jgi:hypothetical protein
MLLLLAVSGAEGRASDEVIAKVNGASITRSDVDRATKALLKQNRTPAPTDPEQKKKYEEAALNQLVAAEVLYQSAKKQDFPDLDKKVDARFEEGKAKFPTKEDFEKELKDNKITAPELKDILRRDVIISNYIEKQVSSKIMITTEQAKKFYEENSNKFIKPESGDTVPFDQVKGKIEEYLKGTEVQKQVLAKIEKLKKSAKIEYPSQNAFANNIDEKTNVNTFVESKLTSPPSLTTSISFSEPSGNNVLDAEETGKLVVNLENSGTGDAYDVKLEIVASKDLNGLVVAVYNSASGIAGKFLT